MQEQHGLTVILDCYETLREVAMPAHRTALRLAARTDCAKLGPLASNASVRFNSAETLL
jgi:hypothetical protein